MTTSHAKLAAGLTSFIPGQTVSAELIEEMVAAFAEDAEMLKELHELIRDTMIFEAVESGCRDAEEMAEGIQQHFSCVELDELTIIDVVESVDSEERCQSCGSMPGDGVTPGCTECSQIAGDDLEAATHSQKSF